MHFGYIEGEKCKPEPGKKSTCAYCNGELIAHCGTHKIWHWHHKSKISCDGWWEPETDWHRNWKMLFPREQQEVIQLDKTTGERHIADIRTDKGYVLELQHSILKEDELKAREIFYGDALVWIVDGMRLEFDRFNFNFLRKGDWPNFTFGWYCASKLPHRWTIAQRPVFFDFGCENLFRLESFDPIGKTGMVKAFTKRRFISYCGITPTEEEIKIVLDPIGYRNK